MSTPMPPYYLTVTGGSLTIVTSLVTAFGGTLNSVLQPLLPILGYVNQLEVFALKLLPGLAVLYLGQRFLKRPERQLQTSLAGSEAISLVGRGVFDGRRFSLTHSGTITALNSSWTDMPLFLAWDESKRWVGSRLYRPYGRTLVE